MAQSYRSRFLSVMRRNEEQMNALFARVAAELIAAIQRVAEPDGTVPRQALFDLQQRAHELTRRLYLGRNRRGEWAPFDTLPNGRVVPLSPYMRVLWDSISAAVRIPVEQNAAMMGRNLSPGMLNRMSRATRDPFAMARERVREQAADLVRPNPLARYDAPHLWVDPNGYTLSERIWNTEAATRRHLDFYLDTSIRQGRSALQMSQDLERFLVPGRAAVRTAKPYGNRATLDGVRIPDVSFDAMRLARTEISRAHQEATRVSATMNPFVEGMKWNLSLSHPRRDICDDLAAGGPAGDGVYSVEDYPERPHPQCLCYPTQVTIDSAESDHILDVLSDDIQAARAEFVDLVGPVAVEQFEALLLGEQITVVEQPALIVQPIRTAPVAAEPTAEQARERLERIYAEAQTQIEAEIDAYLRITKDEMKPFFAELNDATKAFDAAIYEAAKEEARRRIQSVEDRFRSIQDRRQVHLDNQRRIEQERSAGIRRVTHVRNPAANRLTWEGAPRIATREHWQSGMNEFNQLISADAWTDAEVKVERIDKGGRAFARTDSIHISTTEDIGTIVHEIGHIFERQSGALPRVLEFYDKRTAGDELELLSDITGNSAFGATEVARRDKWINPYMGKDYKRRATEIVSLGVEYMYRDPLRFAREDPEMFDFIFDLLRGR